VRMNNGGLRELNPEEMLLVAGGDYTTVNTDPDGAVITAHYNDAGFLQSLTADYSGAGSSSLADNLFACIGAAEVFAVGACWGAGDLYVYGGLGGGPSPVDVTIGYSDNVASILSGPSAAVSGQEGFVESFNPDGSIAATAFTFGAPGGQLTWGDTATNVMAELDSTVAEFNNDMHALAAQIILTQGAGSNPGGGDDGGGFQDQGPVG
jgi:hypothetical protein